MLSKPAQNRLIRLAQKYLDKTPRQDRSGAYSRFFQLSESIGIKTSWSGEEYTVELYERARKCHAIGCGPYVFGLFYHADYGICFLVELVPVFNSLAGRNPKTYEGNEFFHYSSSHYWARETRLGKMVNHLVRKLYYKANFSFGDAHGGNIAYKRGQVLVIDFDQFQTYNNTELANRKLLPKVKV